MTLQGIWKQGNQTLQERERGREGREGGEGRGRGRGRKKGEGRKERGREKEEGEGKEKSGTGGAALTEAKQDFFKLEDEKDSDPFLRCGYSLDLPNSPKTPLQPFTKLLFYLNDKSEFLLLKRFWSKIHVYDPVILRWVCVLAFQSNYKLLEMSESKFLPSSKCTSQCPRQP